MRVLVTGGAGFIGLYLCERLLAAGHQVVCLDNFLTAGRDGLATVLDNPAFTLLERDVVDPLELEGEVERIFNLACPASPVHYQRDPIRTAKTSVYGAVNMLELAKRRGARILQGSTSEIYGDPDVHPQREEYWGRVNPIGPRACYDESKRMAETLVMDYRRMFGLDTKIVRIFNTYGPRMNLDDGRVVSNFIVQALRNDPITIYSDGAQTRAFCFVTDTVEGILRMMDKNGFPGPVNLGNPEDITIRQLANLVLELTGSRSKLTFLAGRVDDPVNRQPDIGLAGRELGWEPATALREGLVATITYFEGVLSGGGGVKA